MDAYNENERKRWTIYPEDRWKTAFDFFIAILTLYFCIIVPYRISFEPETSKSEFILELVFDFCFFIDIGMRFRCAYWDEVALRDDGYAMTKHYLKGWFWIDAFSSFPY